MLFRHIIAFVKSAEFSTSNTKNMVYVSFHWILKSERSFRRILCENPRWYGGYLNVKVVKVVPADTIGGGGGSLYPG